MRYQKEIWEDFYVIFYSEIVCTDNRVEQLAWFKIWKELWNRRIILDSIVNIEYAFKLTIFCKNLEALLSAGNFEMFFWNSFSFSYPLLNHKWVKVLKNLKWYGLPILIFLKAVFHKFYFSHSWIPWPKWT